MYRERAGVNRGPDCGSLRASHRIDRRGIAIVQTGPLLAEIDPAVDSGEPADEWSRPDRDHHEVRARYADVPSPGPPRYVQPYGEYFHAVPLTYDNGSDALLYGRAQ